MNNNAPLFGITDEDITQYLNRQNKDKIYNHPLRDMETMTFFGAMMSDDADFTKHGLTKEEAIELLGERDK